MSAHDLPLTLVESLVRAHSEMPDQREPFAASGERAAPGPPFTITISREVGALGNSVANEVGRRLGWPVYDRALLDKIAEELRRPTAHVLAVDERPASWLEEALSGLMGQCRVSFDAYLKYLIGAVRGLGALGRSVLVGRGANFILPTESTLRVRLVSSLANRIQVIARRLELSPREAAAWIDKTERERVEFVKRHFEQDPTDPNHYDLVLNMSRLTIEEAADTIVEMLWRFEKKSKPAAVQPGAKAEQMSPVLT